MSRGFGIEQNVHEREIYGRKNYKSIPEAGSERIYKLPGPLLKKQVAR